MKVLCRSNKNRTPLQIIWWWRFTLMYILCVSVHVCVSGPYLICTHLFCGLIIGNTKLIGGTTEGIHCHRLNSNLFVSVCGMHTFHKICSPFLHFVVIWYICEHAFALKFVFGSILNCVLEDMGGLSSLICQEQFKKKNTSEMYAYAIGYTTYMKKQIW